MFSIRQNTNGSYLILHDGVIVGAGDTPAQAIADVAGAYSSLARRVYNAGVGALFAATVAAVVVAPVVALA